MPLALVIDADSRARSVVRQALSRYGFGVYEVESDKDAGYALAEIRPDLVLFNFKGQEDGWRIFADLRFDTDVPVILFTDQSVPDTYKDRVDGNTRVLETSASVEQVMAAVMRMGNFSTKNTQLLNPPIYDQREVIPLCMLNSQLVQAIDCALKEVGEYGEVRLTVQRGHLRFLVKLKIEDLP